MSARGLHPAVRVGPVVAPGAKPEEVREAALAFLRANPGHRFAYDGVAARIGIPERARRLVSALSWLEEHGAPVVGEWFIAGDGGNAVTLYFKRWYRAATAEHPVPWPAEEGARPPHRERCGRCGHLRVLIPTPSGERLCVDCRHKGRKP